VQQRNPTVRPALELLAVLSIMLLAVNPGGPLLEWLKDPANSNVTQALSTAVQAVFAVALFVTTIVTIWLARRTVHETANAEWRHSGGREDGLRGSHPDDRPRSAPPALTPGVDGLANHHTHAHLISLATPTPSPS
jgi:hypothetical protein